jgi:type II secretory pathway pseudopilin PulG
MILRPRKSASPLHSEHGYILITLILFVALIAVAAMVLLPAVAFQVKRDREEELIHRGVQYSRAMKHFVKKFGRYPTRIEELENTNQVHFLRRRYKDPITGKDFKLLHMGDVQMAFGAGMPGVNPANGLNPGAAGIAGGPGGPGLGGPGGVPNGAINTVALAGGLAAAGMNQGSPNPGVSTNPGVNGQTQDQDGNGGDDATGAAAPPPANPGATQAAAGPGAPGTFGAVNQGNSAPGAQVFGGGPMVGVASTSKDKSIRVFSKKDHYNQWQFIYDPSTDRGGLLTTPNQRSLQGATGVVQSGVPGAPGTSNTGVPGQPGSDVQPGQPGQPGMETPQMPPDQEQ